MVHMGWVSAHVARRVYLVWAPAHTCGRVYLVDLVWAAAVHAAWRVYVVCASAVHAARRVDLVWAAAVQAAGRIRQPVLTSSSSCPGRRAFLVVLAGPTSCCSVFRYTNVCTPRFCYKHRCNHYQLYVTGYRPVCSASGSESPSALLNLHPDEDDTEVAEGTQPPSSTQEMQGAHDAGPPEGRAKRVARALQRYSPSLIRQQLKKKSKKGG